MTVWQSKSGLSSLLSVTSINGLIIRYIIRQVREERIMKAWVRYYDQLQLYFIQYMKGMLHINAYPIF